VLRADILFFDSNPIGRIVTRFAKDVTVVDLIISVFMIFISNGLFRTATVIITLGIINPWLFIAVAIAVGMMAYILR
jgi:ABC-type multidrug transport system fused ATPase/permease subunit